jgi:small subunit ribosomal protein S18
MAKVKKRGSSKNMKDAGRRGGKKKVSILSQEKIEYVDWKDANLLRRFVSERAKIRARRVNGNDTQQQKLVADAIKVAREMALIPYASRVTTQRSNRDRGERGERGGRADGPAPRPSGPPPGSDDASEDRDETPDTTEIEGVTIDGDQATIADASSEESDS